MKSRRCSARDPTEADLVHAIVQACSQRYRWRQPSLDPAMSLRTVRAMAGSFRALWLIALLVGTFAQATEVPIARYDHVEIAPTKTSIYIGSVSMTMPSFVREHGAFTSTYTAKVFPYFFYNEKGRLSIAISDATLR